MNHLLEGFPATDFARPGYVTQAWIDPWTGFLAREDCPSPLRVDFLAGTEPRTACTKDHTLDWEAIHNRAAADSVARAARDSAAYADSLARGAI
jgi:hypothetical protein